MLWVTAHPDVSGSIDYSRSRTVLQGLSVDDCLQCYVLRIWDSCRRNQAGSNGRCVILAVRMSERMDTCLAGGSPKLFENPHCETFI